MPEHHIRRLADHAIRRAPQDHVARSADPVYCGIAAYRGSRERPDIKFADAVRATVEKGNVPNLDMPKDAYFDPADLKSETATHGPKVAPNTPAATPDDRERGWSSALFPAKSAKRDGASGDMPKCDAPAEESRSTDHGGAHATAMKAPADSLFVPRSSEWRPQ